MFWQWREYPTFFRSLARDRLVTGALVPSSQSLAAALAEPIRQSRHENLCILEVGPGTGVVTAQIAPHLREQDRLDLVELQEAFVRFLEHRLQTDPVFIPLHGRVRLFHGAVEDVLAIPVGTVCGDGPGVMPTAGKYDYIVSGLPFNNFPAEKVARIFELFRTLLKPGGTLSWFEYMHLRKLRMAMSRSKRRRQLGELDQLMRETLQKHEVDRRRVWWNLPPAWVHHLQWR